MLCTIVRNISNPICNRYIFYQAIILTYYGRVYIHYIVHARNGTVSPNALEITIRILAYYGTDWIYSRVLLQDCLIQYFTCNTLYTVAEYTLEFVFTTDVQYFALTGELWDIYCDEFWEKWPRYSGTALYIPCHSSWSTTWGHYDDVYKTSHQLRILDCFCLFCFHIQLMITFIFPRITHDDSITNTLYFWWIVNIYD